jgi:nucleoside-diphosphate-sugar epimerase
MVDAVNDLLRCLELGKAGEIYYIAGPWAVSFRELAESIAESEDVPPLGLEFPGSIVWARVATSGFFAAPLGLSVPLGRAGAAFFSEDRHSTCAKVQRELDYVPGYMIWWQA